LHVLGKEYPTLAFHASVTKPFGKGSLISLLQQFQHLHNDKQQISVGFIGYPNVGKSSVINTLRKKKVCKVAPLPGETKVWQYITLFRRIFLIDCPGVVSPAPNESDEDIVLKGSVRVENLQDPTQYIGALLTRTKKEYIVATYGVTDWTDTEDFLEKFARKYGKLHKKGEPDTATVAKIMLNDWLRGKIPFFVPPPDDGTETADSKPHSVPNKKENEEKNEDVDVPLQKFGGLKVRDEFQEKVGVEEEEEEISDVIQSEEEEEGEVREAVQHRENPGEKESEKKEENIEHSQEDEQLQFEEGSFTKNNQSVPPGEYEDEFEADEREDVLIPQKRRKIEITNSLPLFKTVPFVHIKSKKEKRKEKKASKQRKSRVISDNDNQSNNASTLQSQLPHNNTHTNTPPLTANSKKRKAHEISTSTSEEKLVLQKKKTATQKPKEDIDWEDVVNSTTK